MWLDEPGHHEPLLGDCELRRGIAVANTATTANTARLTRPLGYRWQGKNTSSQDDVPRYNIPKAHAAIA